MYTGVFFGTFGHHQLKWRTDMSTKSLTPLEELCRKQKLPTIMELLNKSLEDTKPTYLAKELDFDYTNLYKVIRERRRLPLNQTILLARMHGFDDVQALFMHAFQEMNPDGSEMLKNQRPVKKQSVLQKESSKLVKKAAAARTAVKASK